MMYVKSSEKEDHGDNRYTDCHECHNPLSYCYCKFPYCGQRDECEVQLFDEPLEDRMTKAMQYLFGIQNR